MLMFRFLSNHSLLQWIDHRTVERLKWTDRGKSEREKKIRKIHTHTLLKNSTTSNETEWIRIGNVRVPHHCEKERKLSNRDAHDMHCYTTQRTREPSQLIRSSATRSAVDLDINSCMCVCLWVSVYECVYDCTVVNRTTASSRYWKDLGESNEWMSEGERERAWWAPPDCALSTEGQRKSERDKYVCTGDQYRRDKDRQKSFFCGRLRQEREREREIQLREKTHWIDLLR